METRHIFVILTIVFTRSILIGSEEISNGGNESEDSPRLYRDSYIRAYATTRQGSSKPVDKRIIYVTPANHILKKPMVSQSAAIQAAVNQPIVVQPTVIQPADIQPADFQPSAFQPIAFQPATVNKTTLKRREDNNYDTGPNAEPTGYNSFSSSGAGGSQYEGYSSGYDNTATDSYFPQPSYGPPKKYGVPGYKQPNYNYGTPDNSYGVPSNQYGPPSSGYGAPLKPTYGVPYGAPSFFDKFSLKFDILTLAKIMLKVIIFKKIVKFIAIICMLMFIPKLIHYKKGNDNDEDEERLLKNFNTREQSFESLNILSAFVQQAIDTYSMQQQGCENVGCRIKRVLDKVDDEYTYAGMADMFKGYQDQ